MDRADGSRSGGHPDAGCASLLQQMSWFSLLTAIDLVADCLADCWLTFG